MRIQANADSYVVQLYHIFEGSLCKLLAEADWDTSLGAEARACHGAGAGQVHILMIYHKHIRIASRDVAQGKETCLH